MGHFPYVKAVKVIRKGVQWSKEPDEEPDYSDWKITFALKNKQGGDPIRSPTPSRPSTLSSSSPLLSSITFSVHRNMLGPQSEYFNRIFKSNNDASSSVSGFSEARHQHSHINFRSNISIGTFGLIVKSFEGLLDYCYDPESADWFDGASPVALLYLCDYFQMEDVLKRKVEAITRTHCKIASPVNLHILYKEIIEFRTLGFNVEQAQTITSEICYDRRHLLSKGTTLATIADLSLWLDVALIIQKRAYKRCKRKIDLSEIKITSNSWSLDIANFLENNDVDPDSFEKLTGKKTLPYVSVNAALVLLKEEQKIHYTYCTTPEVDISNDDDDDTDIKGTESPALTDLQRRCLDSLLEAQLELDSNKKLRDRAMKVMILLPRVMEMYLNKTLNSYGEMRSKLQNKNVNLEHQVYTLTRGSKQYQQNNTAKRIKIEQDTVRLMTVEKELDTEKVMRIKSEEETTVRLRTVEKELYIEKAMRKTEQKTIIRLRNVEKELWKELDTEKEKYRLLAELVNNNPQSFGPQQHQNQQSFQRTHGQPLFGQQQPSLGGHPLFGQLPVFLPGLPQPVYPQPSWCSSGMGLLPPDSVYSSNTH